MDRDGRWRHPILPKDWAKGIAISHREQAARCRDFGMRFRYSLCVVQLVTAGLCLSLFHTPVRAEGKQDAHSLAERFAAAHESKPKETRPENVIRAEQVKGAFEVRKQESELKSTDEILDSIEARTKAIEDLLEKTAPKTAPINLQSNTWDATLTTPSTESETTTTAPTSEDQSQTTDITDLPEPGYALGGPVNLRDGLAEASEILTTATVLLTLTPGNKGLRRFKKTADPVLCGRRHCYRSQGFEKKADRMHRGATLGPFNTLGLRAGSCRQTLACAFRHIDLMDNGVLLQPVDLKFMRHDRRAYRNVKPDETCRISAGRLFCANPIIAKTWKAWVVPEHIARQAGREALELALQEGLPKTPVQTIQVKNSK